MYDLISVVETLLILVSTLCYLKVLIKFIETVHQNMFRLLLRKKGFQQLIFIYYYDYKLYN